MIADDYTHPASGRIYRIGDPAHTYAQAFASARRVAAQFVRETEHLVDADYLNQFKQRPDRSTYALRDALDFLFHAEQGVRIDLYRREPPDAEWNRRYGVPT